MKHFTGMIAIFILSFLINYYSLLQDKKNEARQNISKIELILDKNFEYTEKLLIFVGKKIAENDNFRNLNKIHQIFSQTANSQGYNSLFSWTMFDWIDRQNNETVTSLYGVNKKNPTNMSSRSYTWKGVSGGEFWEMHVSKPAIGTTSQVKILPIGLRVANKKNAYIGSVALGINIKKLVNEINSQIVSNGKFMLINKNNYEYILGSHNINHNEHEKNLEIYSQKTKSLSNKREFSQTSFLRDTFAFGNSIFVHSLLMEGKYPYIILTGYDKEELFNSALNSSILFFIKALIIVLMIRILSDIYFYRYVAMWMNLIKKLKQ